MSIIYTFQILFYMYFSECVLCFRDIESRIERISIDMDFEYCPFNIAFLTKDWRKEHSLLRAESSYYLYSGIRDKIQTIALFSCVVYRFNF